MTSSGSDLTKDFFNFVKAVGEARSKQEEDRIISDEVASMKRRVQETNLPRKKLKEMLIRLIYVEMLGHEGSFAYIRAIELTASQLIAHKRVGYLASSICLSPEHEFRFMLVNQLQRDLHSSNLLEVTAALVALCKLLTQEMIPAMLNDITELLTHDSELVRKRAVAALHRCFQLEHDSVTHLIPRLRRALCDKDPSVMAASLGYIYELVLVDPHPFKDLVPSLVSILKQITEHRLGREHDYHRIPAPWMQMALLRILAVLGRGDRAASEGMYEVLVDVMRRADTGINVGYAIVYETIRTITTIYPNPTLLDAAASAIARLMRLEHPNIKYIAIKSLASIVKDHPHYAADHQLAVIECLDDPDETLKRKTLELLHQMTNPVNVEFITDKLLHFLGAATDDFFRTGLVQRITQCAEQYAPSNSWYIQTMTSVFELAADKVQPEVAHTLMQLVADGTGEDDEEADMELRTEAVESFVELLQAHARDTARGIVDLTSAGTGEDDDPNAQNALEAARQSMAEDETPTPLARRRRDARVLPALLMQTMAWVLGEYGYLSEIMTKQEIMQHLCDVIEEAHISTETRCYLFSALMKLVAQSGSCPARVVSLVTKYSDSVSVDLQQRCKEFLGMLQHTDVMVDVLPVDASCEDLEVDENLSFLDGFVQEALARGAVEYSPPEEDEDEDAADFKDSAGPRLHFTPYAKPTQPGNIMPSTAGVGAMAGVPGGTGIVNGAGTTGAAGAGAAGGAAGAAGGPGAGGTPGQAGLNLRGVATVWGRRPAAAATTDATTPHSAAAGAGAGGGTPATGGSGAATPGATPNANADGNTNGGSNSGGSPGSTGASSVESTPVEPEQPRVLTEKERMAQQLFGGIPGAGSSGGSTGGAGSGNRRGTRKGSDRRRSAGTAASATVSSAGGGGGAATTAPPGAAPATATTNGGGDAGGLDLLDMEYSGDSAGGSTTSVAADIATASPPTAQNSEQEAAGGGDLISDMFAGMDTGAGGGAAPTLTPAVLPTSTGVVAAAPVASNDPFGSASLSPGAALDAVSAAGDGPLMHNGQTMQAWPLTTQEFGGRWGSLGQQVKVSVMHTTHNSLETLAAQLEKLPAHHVQSIPKTMEAIAAARLSPSGVPLLIHAKLVASRNKIDLTIKSNDMPLVQTAAEQLQKLLA